MLGDNSMKCMLNNNTYSMGNIQQQSAKEISKTIITPYCLLILFMLTTNLMLIYGFYKTSRPFTITTKLFIYLSVVDIAMTLFKTFYAMQGFLNFKVPCLVVLLVVVLMEFTYIYGLCIFATISFLRYHSIKKPLQSINSSRLIIVLVVQGIFCGLLTSSLLVMIYLNVESKTRMQAFYFLPISQFLAVAFVLIVNIMSYRKLKAMKRMTKFSESVQSRSTQRQRKMSEANTCLLYITAFYLMCPLPMFALSLLAMFERKWFYVTSYSSRMYLFTFTQMLYMANTGINSLIVILRTNTLRNFYRFKYCCSPARFNMSVRGRSGTELTAA